MKKNIISLLFLLTLHSAGYCGQVSRIELTDGSVIKGEITSFENGSYTLHTASLGEIKIDETRVAKIESAESSFPNPSPGSGGLANNVTSFQFDAYQQKIMNNPENAAVIRNLATNPQIRELAEDPDIVNAIQSNNMQELLMNKKFSDVLSSPEIEEATKEVRQ